MLPCRVPIKLCAHVNEILHRGNVDDVHGGEQCVDGGYHLGHGRGPF